MDPDEIKIHPVPWCKLTPVDQEFHLRLLWEDGYTERAIGRFFQTTKGVIVGRRRRLGIQNSPDRRTRLKRRPITIARLSDLLELHDLAENEASDETRTLEDE